MQGGAVKDDLKSKKIAREKASVNIFDARRLDF